MLYVNHDYHHLHQTWNIRFNVKYINESLFHYCKYMFSKKYIIQVNEYKSVGSIGIKHHFQHIVV